MGVQTIPRNLKPIVDQLCQHLGVINAGDACTIKVSPTPYGYRVDVTRLRDNAVATARVAVLR